MFLMNYLFNFSEDKAIFAGDGTGVLNQSKNWLKLDPLHNLPALPAVAEPTTMAALSAINPELAVWIDQGDMDSGSILIPSTPARTSEVPTDLEGGIGIRIAPHPDGTPVLLGVGGAKLTVTVCFGKAQPARQPRASPLEISAGVAKSTFTFFNSESNRVDASGVPTSWYFPLDFIKHRPRFNEGKHRIHRYEFSVGIVVVSGGVERHYSHDPDMDIGA